MFRYITRYSVKPANIMLTPNGAKVLDFGIAKRHPLVTLSNDSGDWELTASATVTGQVLGSFAYMSPEQAEGKSVDVRSDVFSFGCVLYEMVTGCKAFKGETAAASLAAVLQAEPPAISDLAPLAPPGLDRVVARCLQKNVAGRFQSMTEVIHALEAAWNVPASSAEGAAKLHTFVRSASLRMVPKNW
jgi:eukaryotic-like serine/threonine-protein kinase